MRRPPPEATGFRVTRVLTDGEAYDYVELCGPLERLHRVLRSIGGLDDRGKPPQPGYFLDWTDADGDLVGEPVVLTRAGVKYLRMKKLLRRASTEREAVSALCRDQEP